MSRTGHLQLRGRCLYQNPGHLTRVRLLSCRKAKEVWEATVNHSRFNTLQADINTAKFNVTGIYPTHDVLLTRDEAPLGFVVV